MRRAAGSRAPTRGRFPKREVEGLNRRRRAPFSIHMEHPRGAAPSTGAEGEGQRGPAVTIRVRADDRDSPTLVDQLRPAVADLEPEAYERGLWATRVLAELERDAGGDE
jgi:hypothetical protein